MTGFHKNTSIFFTNNIMDILHKYFQNDWIEKWIEFVTQKIGNHCCLNAHPFVTMEFVKQHPDFQFNEYLFSSNPNFTLHLALENPEKSWNWNAISMHKNITTEMILQNPDLPWKWEFVSKNPNVTLNFVLLHKEFEWNWNAMCSNPNINVSELIKYAERIDGGWSKLSCNPTFTLDSYFKFPNKGWEFSSICNHKNTTLELLESMLQNPEFNDYTFRLCLGSNPNITFDYILSHTEIIWNYPVLVVLNPNVTVEIMLQHPELRWNACNRFHHNPNITLKTIKQNPLIPDNRGILCNNWNWEILATKPFLGDANEYIERNVEQVLISSIHEYYQQPSLYENFDYSTMKHIEFIFADEYLISRICKC